MFLPSLKPISEEFGVSMATASLSLGVYLAITAVLQLIMGPLSDLIGRRPVVLIGLAVFSVASIGCLFSSNFTVFLGFRILQGAVASGMILSRAIVRDTTNGTETIRVLGVIGTAMALAPMLGPVLGGVLDQAFGWRANFVAYAIFGVAMLWICWRDLHETNATPSTSFTAQFRTYPTLLKSGRFWAWTLCLSSGIGGFYLFISGAPSVAAHFGLSPAITGAGIGIISAGFMAGNLIVARSKTKGMLLIALGRSLAVAGPLAALIVVWSGVDSPAVLFAGAIFVGFGNGLTLPGANAGVMSVNPRLSGSAAGLSGAATVVVGAIVTTLSAHFATGEGGMERLLMIIVGIKILSLLTVVYLWRTSHAD
jgi:DHA1 family bicyclomycin/chloramphenicol resistance-like MFS transporter